MVAIGSCAAKSSALGLTGGVVAILYLSVRLDTCASHPKSALLCAYTSTASSTGTLAPVCVAEKTIVTCF